MQNNRAYIYAFLSMVFNENPSLRAINDLKQNAELLALIGSNAHEYFTTKSAQELEDELNIDFTSSFMANSHPLETAVKDAKVEITSGMDNPVVHFYTRYGYEINLLNTPIATPDHISIELGFMQALVYQNELEAQREFMSNHIISWMPIYLIGVKNLVETPFYRDVADFAIDFLISDYEYLSDAA
jgi:TorA maturation chaperone TorD